MSLFLFIALAAALWSIRNLVLGILAFKDRQKIQREIRVERTRTRFAEARNDLMWLLVKDELRPNSATFTHLYYLNTVILRRPDVYAEISAALRKAFFSFETNSNQNPLFEESKTWTPDTIKVLRKTAAALNYIKFSHSPLWRFLSKFKWLLSPSLRFLQKRLFSLVKYIESRQKKDPVVADIRATRNMISSLIASAY